MKVFDVFNYNGEPIVDARIEYLESSVDHFVIVEGLHTFTGSRKPDYYFNRASFKANPKAIFVPVDDVVPGGAWANEAYQRDAALRVLRVLADDRDLCFCSDADEIPRAEDFDQMGRVADALGGATLVLQDFYYYNFDWKKPTDWPNAFAARGKVLRQYSIQDLRGKIRGGVKSGWHCSYAESADNIRRKIESFSHTECNRDECKTDKHLQDCLQNGKDLFLREDQHLQRVKETLPPALAGFNERIKKVQGVL